MIRVKLMLLFTAISLFGTAYGNCLRDSKIGSCGSELNTCQTGTVGIKPRGQNYYSWSCNGTPAKSCSAAQRKNLIVDCKLPVGCSDTKYCIHNSVQNMTYDQSTNLSAYVKGWKKDMGYCAAASTAMALSFMQNHGYTTSPIVKNFPATNKAQAIYYAGEKIGTDWKNGGTSSEGTFKLFSDIALNKSGLPLSINELINKPNELSLSVMGKVVNTTEILKSYNKYQKPFQRMSLQSGSESHAVVIKGVENNKIKIYDPWGRTYNITIVAGLVSVPVEDIYKDHSFVSRKILEKKKVNISNVISLNLK